MNVIILTEGGKDYGFVHVARCSSIYQAFRKFNITPQFIVNGDKSIDAILQNIDYTILDWQNQDFTGDDIVIDLVDGKLTARAAARAVEG